MSEGRREVDSSRWTGASAGVPEERRHIPLSQPTIFGREDLLAVFWCLGVILALAWWLGFVGGHSPARPSPETGQVSPLRLMRFGKGGLFPVFYARRWEAWVAYGLLLVVLAPFPVFWLRAGWQRLTRWRNGRREPG